MKIINITASAVILSMVSMGCNKTHDYSYRSGKFLGEVHFKEMVFVDNVKTDELYYSESGTVSVINNDSLNFIFNNSLYSVDRTFPASPSNTYQYVLAAEKINDRFDVENNGHLLKYYGTREFQLEGNDTARFFEVTFTGNRE